MREYKIGELTTATGFTAAKERAKQVWYTLSQASFAQNGDAGCCTLGGGLYMYIIDKGCRKAKRKHIMSSPSGYQGEIPKYAGMEEAAEIMREAGFECQTSYGNMD